MKNFLILGLLLFKVKINRVNYRGKFRHNFRIIGHSIGRNGIFSTMSDYNVMNAIDLALL